MKPNTASEISENYQIHLCSQTLQNTKKSKNDSHTPGTTWEIRQD